MDGRCTIVGAPPVRRERCPWRKRGTRARDRAETTDRTSERCLPPRPRGGGWRYGSAHPLQCRDRTSADRLARSHRYRLRRDPAQVGGRAGALAGGPQPVARPDEDRQRARTVALARYRRDGQAGLAAGLRRAGRKPRALGSSALGVARRRNAGARAREASGHLAQIPPDTLKSDYLAICANTGRGGGGPPGGGGPRGGGRGLGRRAAGGGGRSTSSRST